MIALVNHLNKAISLLGFSIQYYSIFILLAIIVGWNLFKEIVSKIYPGSDNQLSNLLVIGFLGAIIGARLWFIMSRLHTHLDFFKIIAIWEGGIAIQGAIIGVVISSYIYIKKTNNFFNIWILSDAFFSILLISQAIGRWGNFYNQEVFGFVISKETTSLIVNSLILTQGLLGIFLVYLFSNKFKDLKKRNIYSYFKITILVVIIGHLINSYFGGFNTFIINNMRIYGKYRLPLFLIEGTVNLFACVLIIIASKATKKIGVSTSLYLISYGIIRAILEPLRNDQDIMKIMGIYVSVVLSIIFVIVGIIILQKRLKKGAKYD